MIRRILILLAVLVLCLSGLPAFAGEAWDAGEKETLGFGSKGFSAEYSQ